MPSNHTEMIQMALNADISRIKADKSAQSKRDAKRAHDAVRVRRKGPQFDFSSAIERKLTPSEEVHKEILTTRRFR